MSRRSERRRRLLQRSQKFQRERHLDFQEKHGMSGSRANARRNARHPVDAPEEGDDASAKNNDAEACLAQSNDGFVCLHPPHAEESEDYSAATSSVSPDHDSDAEEAASTEPSDPAQDAANEEEDPDLSEIGRAPGELPASSPFESEVPTRFRVLRYSEDICEEADFADADRLAIYADPDEKSVTWVQMLGITDPEIVHIVGAIFNLPMLAQEDVLAEWSRTKFDEYNGMALAVARAVRLNLEDTQPKGQQISFIAGSNFVISFHENDEPVFEAVERRIRENTGRQRQGGTGYLFYALFDTLVDRMLYLAEEIEDSISQIEDQNLVDSSNINLGEIHRLKRVVGHLGRLSMPLRETVRRLQRSDHKLLSTLPDMYFSDLNDHVLRVGDRLEHARMILQEIHDFHLTLQSVKTNEIIRLLTVISSVFIPLTFVVGIYGMNFKHMPELETRYGYYICLAAMFGFVAVAFFYFRKKKWL